MHSGNVYAVRRRVDLRKRLRPSLKSPPKSFQRFDIISSGLTHLLGFVIRELHKNEGRSFCNFYFSPPSNGTINVVIYFRQPTSIPFQIGQFRKEYVCGKHGFYLNSRYLFPVVLASLFLKRGLCFETFEQPINVADISTSSI